MKFILRLLIFIIIFIVIFISQISAEEIHLLCVSFDRADSTKLHKQLSKIDSIIKNVSEPLILVSPNNFQTDFGSSSFTTQNRYNMNCINIFIPDIFSEIADTDIVHKYTIDIITSNLKWNNRKNGIEFIQSKVITLSDSLKIGFMGILTPDLPFLYPSLFTNSDEFKFRFGIFDCAKEEIDSLKNQKVDFIILLNYLGNFLDKELMRKFIDIDFVIDGFELDFEEDYKNEFYKNSIIHINFRQPLIKDICVYLHKNEDNQAIIDSLKINNQN